MKKYSYLLLFFMVPTIYGMDEDPGDEDLIDNPYKGYVRSVWLPENTVRPIPENTEKKPGNKQKIQQPNIRKKKNKDQLPYESPGVPDDCPS